MTFGGVSFIKLFYLRPPHICFYTPQKKQKKYYIGTILPFWHFLALLGFFLPPITPQKKPKNDYFDKIWPFWHFLALFGFFFTPYTPKKPKKMTILAKFGHFGPF